MKESGWGYIILTLGIVIIAILLLVQRLTTTNEQDYYLSREIMKASMIDAVDMGVYENQHEIVMSKEKFVAVFTKRFAQSVPADNTYTLSFYDIHEYPPKATVKITTETGETVISDSMIEGRGINFEIGNYISAIIEDDTADAEISKVFEGKVIETRNIDPKKYVVTLKPADPSLKTADVDITVAGLESSVNAVKENEVIAYVDLEGLKEGTITVPVYAEGNVKEVTYTPNPRNVIVQIKAK